MLLLWYGLLELRALLLLLSYVALCSCCIRTMQENRARWRLKNKVSSRGMTPLTLVKKKRRFAGAVLFGSCVLLCLYQVVLSVFLREMQSSTWITLGLLVSAATLSYTIIANYSPTHSSNHFPAQICVFAALLSCGF